MTRTIGKDQARSFYNAFGIKQDAQAFYEDVAIRRLLKHLDLGSAGDVLEIGCGTGRFAARILGQTLADDARYTGVDISDTMIDLARSRTLAWRDRVTLVRGDAVEGVDFEAGAFDLAVSTYVLDIFSEDDIRALQARLHGWVRPGGRMGLVSLTEGESRITKTVANLWHMVHRIRPLTVGGCRPISIEPLLDSDKWRVTHRSTVSAFGLCSEVLVADRIG